MSYNYFSPTNTIPTILANGSVSSPGLFFGVDTSTGLYRIGSNNIGISVSGTKVMDISSTGLTVTGALSATGLLTITKATGGQTVVNTSGNTTGTYQSFGTSAGIKGHIGLGDQISSGGSVNDIGIDGSAGNIIFSTANTTRATVSSTGLTVTGTLSAATITAATITANSVSEAAIFGPGGTSGTGTGNTLTLNSSSAANYGAYVRFQKNSINKGFIAHESAILGGGSTSSNLMIGVEAGDSIKQFIGATGTITTTNSGGFAVTGSASISNAAGYFFGGIGSDTYIDGSAATNVMTHVLGGSVVGSWSTSGLAVTGTGTFTNNTNGGLHSTSPVTSAQIRFSRTGASAGEGSIGADDTYMFRLFNSAFNVCPIRVTQTAANATLDVTSTGLSVTGTLDVSSNVLFSSRRFNLASYAGLGETYSNASTVIGCNIYVDVADAVPDQIRTRNTHGTYGHTAYFQAGGTHAWYGAANSVTAGAVVTKVSQMTLTPAGLSVTGKADIGGITGLVRTLNVGSGGVNTDMRIYTTAASAAAGSMTLYFANSTSDSEGWLTYDNAARTLGVRAGATNVASFSSTGLAVTGSITAQVGGGAPIILTGNAAALIGLGGLTSSYPALRYDAADRVGIVKADQSAYANLQAAAIIGTTGVFNNVLTIKRSTDASQTMSLSNESGNADYDTITGQSHVFKINASEIGRISATGLTVTGYVTPKFGTTTYATLASAATAGQGAMIYITDCNSNTRLATAAGGGANKVMVFSDGTNWLIL